MAYGDVLTVAVAVLKQPSGKVYDILEVPAVSALTTPVALTTDATKGEEDAHTPPVDALSNVVLLPVHNDSVPSIGPGCGFTVTMAVLLHPGKFS
jgi:hypothetical protein